MLSDDADVLSPADFCQLSVPSANHQSVVFHKGPELQLLLDAERNHARSAALRQRITGLVVIIDHEPSVRGLIGKDFRFCRTVGLHRMVPVQMVRRKIQDC